MGISLKIQIPFNFIGMLSGTICARIIGMRVLSFEKSLLMQDMKTRKMFWPCSIAVTGFASEFIVDTLRTYKVKGLPFRIWWK